MIPETMFGAGILIALAAACWAKLKAFGARVVNLLIAKEKFEHLADNAIRAYLWEIGKRSPFGPRTYGGYEYFVRPLNRRQVVGTEMLSSDTILFWVGWRPLWACFGPGDPQGRGDPTLSLTYIRGMFDIEDMLRKAITRYNADAHGESRRNRYQVFRVTGRGKLGMMGATRPDSDGELDMPKRARSNDIEGQISRSTRYLDFAPDELGEPRPSNPFEFLGYPPEGRAVIAAVEWWFAAEREYRSRGVPWRMGVALTGPPGTGKTSMARAIAQKLGLPIYAVELATMTDVELIAAWQRAKNNSPSVVLIEDVDTVFYGRQVVEGGPDGLSFGCLLNCLSGAEGADGVLVFVTTNCPETLDSALGAPDPETGRSTRPGRIDQVVHLGPLDAAGRTLVASKILAGFPADAAWAEAEGARLNMTGAVFQNMCLERAFERIREAQPQHPTMKVN